jgi:hypothetical protein
VRINDDLRKAVVFFGHRDDSPGKGGIRCIGTGFLVAYEEFGYLVTAKHLAQGLGSDPFLLRINKKDGTSENLMPDGAEWAEHPDPSVDVAAIPFNIPASSLYEATYLPHTMMLTEERSDDIGIGDTTYTIGLFHFMSGERRNLPIVHQGAISLMPGDETIPMRGRDGVLRVRGYLIETQGMPGLSGSPVFVRPTVAVSRLSNFIPDPRYPMMAAMMAYAPRGDVRLLGLWQGSWDAPPDQVMAIQSGQSVRVPVGMGIVVPAQRIEETLQIPGLQEMRERIRKKRQEESAAPLDSIPIASPVASSSKEGGPVSDDAEPNRRERFTAPLNAAVRKPGSKD